MRNIKVIEKSMKFIELLAQGSGQKTLAEMANTLTINKTTAYRILRTLVYLGYILQDKHSKKYSLSVQFLQLGGYVLRNIELRQKARPFLEKLWEQTNETVNLMAVEGYKGVLVDVILSNQKIRMVNPLGEQVSFHSSALGKSFLAYLPKQQVDHIIASRGLEKKTERTITDPDKLYEELKEIRSKSYVIDDGEDIEGCVCVGAPVFNHVGMPVGSISISGPMFRLRHKNLIDRITPLVISTADKISKGLGKTNSLNNSTL